VILRLIQIRGIAVKTLQKGQLSVQIYETRDAMGKAAAADVTAKLKALLTTRENVRMVFASAPSQQEFFAYLTEGDADFGRVTAFHLDEYIGLEADAPQGFGNFLQSRVFSKVNFGKINFIDGQAADPQAECGRYAALLAEAPIDIVCMGIGENAHIAFNDPHVADFNDPLRVKVVELDAACRTQQVNDGCFAALDDVPTHAITLTIPALLDCGAVFCMVPGPAKADAVYNSLEKEITTRYPASILRTKAGATLYLDTASSAGLLR
jgi:glucosamine-6-phosphate deaminase